MTAAAAAVGPVRIRLARPEDHAAVGALTAEAYRADGLLEVDDEYEVELRDAARRAREAVLLVATAADRDDEPAEAVVGTLTLAPYATSYAEIAEPGELELRMLAVAPGARGRGVAARLVTAALREAVARRARGVVLSTLAEMATARRLYDRLGFAAAPDRDWGHEGVHLQALTWVPPVAPGVLVEAATWVPVATRDVDGWRLGLSGGFTRRANSALPLGTPEDLAATLGRVEAVYAAAGQPSVVRVCSGAPDGLAAALAARGYAERAATDVLVRDLAALPPERAAVPPDVRVTLADEPDDTWLAGWLGVKAAGGAVDPATARAVVAGSPALYLTATGADGATLAVLRAALADGWTGLSCLMVEPAARRRGLGRLLTRAGLRAAADRGARRAFLQVEVGNPGAADLYAGEGFRPAERYAYWER
ncbi:GNAT family N-acetyltransferase [Cellulomonas sp. Y8]|uniref:GNAT family N-acetyltransferase n=1 Tax=Cellulomonas sp. Y8 TaxID=2591145 RepID=UPI003D747236